MRRIAILVATALGAALLALTASAAPIVFAPPQITLATDPFNVTGSMTVALVGLDDPDPNLARFELVIDGEFQNYRGATPSPTRAPASSSGRSSTTSPFSSSCFACPES